MPMTTPEHEFVEGRSCGLANLLLPRARCYLFEEEHDDGWHYARSSVGIVKWRPRPRNPGEHGDV